MSANTSRCLRAFCSLLLLAIAATGCGGVESERGPVQSTPDQWPHKTLSEYGFFVGPLVDLKPAPGVVPYQVAAPLWADHAGKARFIVLPPEGAIGLEGDDWSFPVGTVVIKSFYYSRDRRRPEATATLIETRLLV